MQESNTNICQNCTKITTLNYCANCGQKKNVGRFSIRYILVHDILHGIFHIDKGFLYTLKELFTRPGHSIREYINGKRIRHFHFFTFIIIALLFNRFLSIIAPINISDLEPFFNNSFFETFNTFLKENIKLFTLTVIPIQAFVSFLLFRKSKQNYSEHVVMASYISGATLIIDLILPLSFLFSIKNSTLSNLSFGIELLKIGYSTCFFYQYFSFYQSYNRVNVIVRSFLSSLIVSIITYILITGLIVLELA